MLRHERDSRAHRDHEVAEERRGRALEGGQGIGRKAAAPQAQGRPQDSSDEDEAEGPAGEALARLAGAEQPHGAPRLPGRNRRQHQEIRHIGEEQQIGDAGQDLHGSVRFAATFLLRWVYRSAPSCRAARSGVPVP